MPNDTLQLLPQANHKVLSTLRQEFFSRVNQNKKGFLRYREPLESVADLQARDCVFDRDVVVIGRKDEINDTRRQQLEQILRAFMPWRKGPFQVFGIDIDAEWRSERKWNRLKPVLPSLDGKIIADIGSNNGYYMFRMLPGNPKLVVGFEPYIQHYFAFQTLNSLAGQRKLYLEPLGVEHIHLYPQCFDVVFLMGILYHHASPIEMLRTVQSSLRKGGHLIIESQAIPGDQPVALFPEKRYAKVPGTYFVPTASCLVNWLKRVGFANVEVFDSHPMNNLEQRKTDWMVFESYDDFIDPLDHTKTVEGYPAPLRVYIRCSKS